MSKYLEFRELKTLRIKDKKYIQINRTKDTIGYISWNETYHKYCFECPLDDYYYTIIETKELRQIANFLDKLNKGRNKS